MRNPKKLAISISIGVLILIGLFAVISLTPSGLFTGAMRNLKKDGLKTGKSAAWWCMTEREAQKKWFKMWEEKDSGNGMIASNIPQPKTPPEQNPIPPEDKNEGTSKAAEKETPPATHEKQPEYSDEQYCKDLAAGNVSSGCDCGQKTKFDTTCHVTVTCNYWPSESVCDPKWRCPTGYVQDEAGVDEKCVNETLHVKQLQCAGKKAIVNPDLKKVCEAFDSDNIFGLLDKPCVEKDQCEHLKKLFDEGIETNEALTQLGMSSDEYDSCTALFNKEWSGEKAW